MDAVALVLIVVVIEVAAMNPLRGSAVGCRRVTAGAGAIRLPTVRPR